MSQLTIVPYGDAGALVLPTDVLESTGLRVGDTVELALHDHELILKPSADAVRRQLFERLTQEVIEQRRDALRRLA